MDIRRHTEALEGPNTYPDRERTAVSIDRPLPVLMDFEQEGSQMRAASSPTTRGCPPESQSEAHVPQPIAAVSWCWPFPASFKGAGQSSEVIPGPYVSYGLSELAADFVNGGEGKAMGTRETSRWKEQ